jgi:Protein of unknown function (DUF2690)
MRRDFADPEDAERQHLPLSQPAATIIPVDCGKNHTKEFRSGGRVTILIELDRLVIMHRTGGSAMSVEIKNVRVAVAGFRAATAIAMIGLTTTLGIVVVGPASPVLAATGCGSKCDLKDPQTFIWQYSGPAPGVAARCSDDVVSKKTASGIALRYSASCRTAWAKNTTTAPPGTQGHYWQVEVQRFKVGGAKIDSAWGTNWSLMLNDAGYESRACLYDVYRDGESEVERLVRCTDKY